MRQQVANKKLQKNFESVGVAGKTFVNPLACHDVFWSALQLIWKFEQALTRKDKLQENEMKDDVANFDTKTPSNSKSKSNVDDLLS